MRDSQSAQAIRLADYQPSAFLIDSVDLHFDLGQDTTQVRALLRLRANPAAQPSSTLQLDGRALELVSIKLDDQPLDSRRYRRDDNSLSISDVPEAFSLEIETRLRPQDNTSLEGLFRSKGTFCTQCEAQGFRKITYYLDRPDILARFTTTITGDPAHYPVMLSNGNLVEQGVSDDGRRWVRWEDPFPKPAYLFALVAGDLAMIEDRFTTRSGREVALQIFVEHHNRERCAHAMRSLQQAMAWDERRFGLEYDLDIYMIVAVDDFNMGAMENKGLNVFNSKYVLADPATATDEDYLAIQAVIGHEYFHNWTGNRVTLRDWFQLSLKEGLTVFRDQEFSSDMGARAVKRIEDVKLLRSRQFAEDAGPMSHPVRPDSYIEINNFYTLTVYEKGSEVIRMLHTLLGESGFRRGMDVYFERHDGQAVTCDDFVAAMSDANGADLELFKRWYGQAGTPEVRARGEYDAAARRYRLYLSQRTAPTPGQPHKQALLVPVAMALLDGEGREMPLRLSDEPVAVGGSRVLWLQESEQVFEFVEVAERPVPSLLRGFSAPVKLHTDETDADLAFRMAHDGDSFNRWDAAQRYATRVLTQMVAELGQGGTAETPQAFVDAFGKALADTELDPALLAETLQLPSEGYLAEQMAAPIDPDTIHAASEQLRRALAHTHAAALGERYRDLAADSGYSQDAQAIGRRRLKNLCLQYLVAGGDPEWSEAARGQMAAATNMSDELAALRALNTLPPQWREPALEAFYQKWRGEALVIDKWLSVQATAADTDAPERVEALLTHPAFDVRNPNRVRSLVGAFAMMNPVGFHRADGAGYRFLADRVRELDRLNPQVASRMAQAFSAWRRYDEQRRQLMRTALDELAGIPGLSRDVYEVISKTLAAE